MRFLWLYAIQAYFESWCTNWAFILSKSMDCKTLYLMQPNEALKNMHRSLETRKQRNNNAGKQNQNDVTRNRLSQTFIGAAIQLEASHIQRNGSKTKNINLILSVSSSKHILFYLKSWWRKTSVATFQYSPEAVRRKFCWNGLALWSLPNLTDPPTWTMTVFCPPTNSSRTGCAS